MPVDATAITLRYLSGSQRAAIIREIRQGYRSERIAADHRIDVSLVRRLRYLNHRLISKGQI